MSQNPRIALVTGITGQDGAYLAQLLLGKGYTVYGTYRPTGTADFWRIQELGIKGHVGLHLLEYDLVDAGNTSAMLAKTGAREVYNLASQSPAVESYQKPAVAANVTGMGALNLLEAIRTVDPGIRFFQASSSELFGNASDMPQTEQTAFRPTSPYGVAKLFAHWLTVNYRESYGIFGCNGILFNHESPLRGREFVTRKITESFARIRLGQQEVVELGNLGAKRDWGFAREYVEAMWMMLQAETPDSYILATNRMETVRDFVALAAQAAGFELRWEGAAEHEVGIDRRSGKTLVRVNSKFYRPAEVHLRIGNPEKALRQLGWCPRTSLAELCQMMVEADIRRLQHA